MSDEWMIDYTAERQLKRDTVEEAARETFLESQLNLLSEFNSDSSPETD